MKNDKHPVVASPPRGSIRALRVPFKIGRTGPRVVFNPRVPRRLKFSRSNLNLAIIDVKLGIFPRHRFFTRFAYCRPVSVGIAWISPSNGVGQVTKFSVYQREPRAACLLFGCSRVLRLNVAPYHLGTIFRDIKYRVADLTRYTLRKIECSHEHLFKDYTFYKIPFSLIQVKYWIRNKPLPLYLSSTFPAYSLR